MATLRRLWRLVAINAPRGASAVGGILFLGLFGVFLVQIAARFLWNHPLPWTDEAASILYIWVILWAAATMVPHHEHVALDLLWNHAGPRTRCAMHALGHAIVGGLCLCGLPASWDYLHFMARETTSVLELPFFWVYLPMGILLLALVFRSAVGLGQALFPARFGSHE